MDSTSRRALPRVCRLWKLAVLAWATALVASGRSLRPSGAWVTGPAAPWQVAARGPAAFGGATAVDTAAAASGRDVRVATYVSKGAKLAQERRKAQQKRMEAAREESKKKENVIEMKGEVVQHSRNVFKVILTNSAEVQCTLAGKLRMNNIKVLEGDQVTVELSPFDLKKGRITYRSINKGKPAEEEEEEEEEEEAAARTTTAGTRTSTDTATTSTSTTTTATVTTTLTTTTTITTRFSRVTDGLPGGIWFSLPGACPEAPVAAKTAECVKRMPGGACSTLDQLGGWDCTYHAEPAGEVSLDEISGILDKEAGIASYEDFWEASFSRCMMRRAQYEQALYAAEHVVNATRPSGPPPGPCVRNIEFNPLTDRGVGTSFWDGKHSLESAKRRMDSVRELFRRKYPHFPDDHALPAPPCL